MAVLAERIARALIGAAARRWPAGVAETLRQEWQAELAALHGRPWRMLTFATSLATAPTTDRPWPQHAAAAARAGTAATLVVLLAAALFNGVHLALHTAETRLPWSGEAVLVCALLAASALLMALAGARRQPRRPVRAAILTGAAAYAFLLAGNETAVMPFMGWRDVTPAVAAWTALTLLTTWATSRLRASGRTRPAALTAIIGGLLSVQSAAVAGSLHAAATLGIPVTSAPAWFPLSMLPGGTGGFGPHVSPSPPSTAPAVYASDILLANTAALTGPLLLCTAYLTATLLTTGSTRSQAHLRRPAIRFAGRIRHAVDPTIVAAAGTAGAILLLTEHLPRAATAADLALPRIIDNSSVFGFGFLAHPAGRAILAFAAALLLAHHLTARRQLAHLTARRQPA
ncbi:hypothetical protein AB0F81_45325 [Actinoplanes sp. NPDC024001]|uniref:hypothetical protein n=1 Tax=Actinoplanes sp. NPDC024001 TaxID=3154598 RepID=UPI0033C94F0B